MCACVSICRVLVIMFLCLFLCLSIGLLLANVSLVIIECYVIKVILALGIYICVYVYIHSGSSVKLWRRNA